MISPSFFLNFSSYFLGGWLVGFFFSWMISEYLCVGLFAISFIKSISAFINFSVKLWSWDTVPFLFRRRVKFTFAFSSFVLFS